ncbi:MULTISPECIES: GntR family transcriptional regulator [Phyllobacteriaceae]|jgi:DNA-binding GntR family transcriptional regulator|uniref:GntR family transcriptional regulator n=1 Tax=Mesorhizobium hungaricum TaxID=1566387 RepID=A0A1C2DNN7_9HYPH|nr:MULTISPECIES: GntR family transcriptional regulator [Mesorhizobium]MBN9233854.1 GntR family transcriptional regulator [Mesorhizobium sp.]MDQ0328337.1 DNA-binding GntR family transcriptional regulator [Mesorhizobium sp. YL-MeA3-2017]OCX16256.1 GntR family transcriptional regulator [Mesorhizobium hungaricum]
MSQMQQVERQLREMILGLDIGPGEKLTERWIESRFGASRTPVRAALLRLETEGLVQRDGRGWTVSPINLAEIEQIAVYRQAVEVAAARLVAKLEDKSGLDAIEAMLDSCGDDTPREEWHRVGTDFHVELARMSGNEFLFRGVRDAMTRLSRARWLEIRDEAASARAWAEHRAILSAIRAGEADEAARLLVLHIGGSRDRLVGSLQTERRGLRAMGFAVVAA